MAFFLYNLLIKLNKNVKEVLKPLKIISFKLSKKKLIIYKV